MGLAGVGRGMVAGAVGVAAMTAAEKLEQQVTGRPNSYVPSRTLAHLIRLRRADADQLERNHLMHWGTGILVGAVRGVMAEKGRRGARASALHLLARLTTDQTLENLAGVGSPPWTWPRRELAIDVGHKAVYSFVTGWVADRLVKPVAEQPVEVAVAPPASGRDDWSLAAPDGSSDGRPSKQSAAPGPAAV